MDSFNIGVFSDSHDNLPLIKKAIDVFLNYNVKKIIHCGDLVAPFIKRAMGALEGKNIEVVGVFGNNDGERANMNRILAPLMEIKGDFMEMQVNGINIAVYHGTDARILDNIIKSGNYDLVLTGHTHQIRIEKINKTLVVNPGETCGYLTGRATVAIVDLANLNKGVEAVKIIDI